MASLFFLHLALEKALRAAYVSAFATHAPYSYNLLVLVEKLGWEVSEERLTLLTEINEFNLESRYPEEKSDFRKKATMDFARHYLHEAEGLMRWISETSVKVS